MADALRSNLAQIRPFPLRKADAWFNYIQRSTLPDTLEENVYFVLGEVNLFFFFFFFAPASRGQNPRRPKSHFNKITQADL